jgi:hypothetical protein
MWLKNAIKRTVAISIRTAGRQVEHVVFHEGLACCVVTATHKAVHIVLKHNSIQPL